MVERLVTPHGELVLRRVPGAGGEPHHEVIANGTFLMDTRDGRSERLLVRAAVDQAARLRGAAHVLVGGLGVGFSLDEALAHPTVGAVTIVEREPAVVRWNREHLGRAALLDDPRTRLIVADLRDWLAATTERFDALCLDVDNGPEWTVTPGNAALYNGAGLDLLRARLTPGGVLAVWSAAPSAAFAAALEQRFAEVTLHTVQVARGEPDAVYLATNGPATSAPAFPV